MVSTDQQVLDAASRWAAAGHRFALVTVARTWGSAPRPAGAWLVLREDGLVEGSVSGGCVEDDLIARMRAGDITGTAPFKLVYGVTKDEATRFGLPCGGTFCCRNWRHAWPPGSWQRVTSISSPAASL